MSKRENVPTPTEMEELKDLLLSRIAAHRLRGGGAWFDPEGDPALAMATHLLAAIRLKRQMKYAPVVSRKAFGPNKERIKTAHQFIIAESHLE